MEIYASRAGVEGRGGGAEVVVPVLFRRILEGGVHDGGKECPGEALEFCLVLCWDEGDIRVWRCVEEVLYVEAEPCWYFIVAGVVVEDAMWEERGVGVWDWDAEGKGEVASIGWASMDGEEY